MWAYRFRHKGQAGCSVFRLTCAVYLGAFEGVCVLKPLLVELFSATLLPPPGVRVEVRALWLLTRNAHCLGLCGSWPLGSLGCSDSRARGQRFL